MDIFTNFGHHTTGKVLEYSVVVLVWAGAQLAGDDTHGHSGDEFVEVLLQVQFLSLGLQYTETDPLLLLDE